MLKEYLEIGKIVGTHGVRGECRVELWCDSGEFFSYFKTLYLDNKGEKSLSVKSRPHKNIALTKINGVEDIDTAQALVGKVLYMKREDCPLPDDVYFVQDIIGCEVKDINDGTIYGKVTDVLRTGANDVYEVKSSQGKTYLMPKIDDVVKEVNVVEECILVEPMKGLFDED
jgi:16S rRNA processing protein RimM